MINTLIWQCGCKCTSFLIFGTGKVLCAECDLEMENLPELVKHRLGRNKEKKWQEKEIKKLAAKVKKSVVIHFPAKKRKPV